MTIDLSLINSGDLVTVQDPAGNVAQGKAFVFAGRAVVGVFGGLKFAHRTRGGEWVPEKFITVTAHQASLFPEVTP